MGEERLHFHSLSSSPEGTTLYFMASSKFYCYEETPVGIPDPGFVHLLACPTTGVLQTQNIPSCTVGKCLACIALQQISR